MPSIRAKISAKLDADGLIHVVVEWIDVADGEQPTGEVKLREEVRLLFCHGLLHLLGHDHRNKAEESAMIARQAQYLNVEIEAAWRHNPSH